MTQRMGDEPSVRRKPLRWRGKAPHYRRGKKWCEPSRILALVLSFERSRKYRLKATPLESWPLDSTVSLMRIEKATLKSCEEISNDPKQLPNLLWEDLREPRENHPATVARSDAQYAWTRVPMSKQTAPGGYERQVLPMDLTLSASRGTGDLDGYESTSEHIEDIEQDDLSPGQRVLAEMLQSAGGKPGIYNLGRPPRLSPLAPHIVPIQEDTATVINSRNTHVHQIWSPWFLVRHWRHHVSLRLASVCWKPIFLQNNSMVPSEHALCVPKSLLPAVASMNVVVAFAATAHFEALLYALRTAATTESQQRYGGRNHSLSPPRNTGEGRYLRTLLNLRTLERHRSMAKSVLEPIRMAQRGSDFLLYRYRFGYRWGTRIWRLSQCSRKTEEMEDNEEREGGPEKEWETEDEEDATTDIMEPEETRSIGVLPPDPHPRSTPDPKSESSGASINTQRQQGSGHQTGEEPATTISSVRPMSERRRARFNDQAQYRQIPNRNVEFEEPSDDEETLEVAPWIPVLQQRLWPKSSSSRKRKGKDRMSAARCVSLAWKEKLEAWEELEALRTSDFLTNNDKYFQSKLRCAEEQEELWHSCDGFKRWLWPWRLVGEGIKLDPEANPYGEGPSTIYFPPAEFLDEGDESDSEESDSPITGCPTPGPSSQSPPAMRPPDLIVVTDFDHDHDGIQILILPEPTRSLTSMDTSIVIPCNTNSIKTFAILAIELSRTTAAVSSCEENYANRLWRGRAIKLRKLIDKVVTVIPDDSTTMSEYATLLGEFGSSEIVRFIALALWRLVGRLRIAEQRVTLLESALERTGCELGSIIQRQHQQVVRELQAHANARDSSEDRDFSEHQQARRQELRKMLEGIDGYYQFLAEVKSVLDNKPAEDESDLDTVLNDLLQMIAPYATTRPAELWRPGCSPAAYAPGVPHSISKEKALKPAAPLIGVADVSIELEIPKKLYYRPASVLAFETQLDSLAVFGALKHQRRQYLRISSLIDPPPACLLTRRLQQVWAPEVRMNTFDPGRTLESNQFGVFSWRHPRKSLAPLENIYLPLGISCFQGKAEMSYHEPIVIREQWLAPVYKTYGLFYNSTIPELLIEPVMRCEYRLNPKKVEPLPSNEWYRWPPAKSWYMARKGANKRKDRWVNDGQEQDGQKTQDKSNNSTGEDTRNSSYNGFWDHTELAGVNTQAQRQ
ncbi:hypothetical protein Dda_2413 [Drechslerella dactyloides]|uniref:Uncharacterized protein n=1 Tax=Drechslerella dactyloides TaxID=74499 RepID=A0AAD6J4C9_DREDA|nr:hypothetical protein Dda_2413 [Drechslerella dactyloides]